MARSNHIVNALTSGEVSERFYGRTDLPQHAQAAEELFNVIVHPQGGVASRPGTRHIKKLTDADGDPISGRLIPFHGSNGTRFNLFITSKAPDIPSGYNPSTDPLEWQAISEVTINGVDTYYIGLPTLAGAAAVYSSYYQYFDLDLIQYAQAGDTIILTHPSFRPLRIVYNPLGSGNLRFDARPLPDPGEWDSAAFGTVTIPATENQTWKQMPFLPLVRLSQGNTKSLVLARGTDTYYTIQPGSGSTITFSPSWVGKVFKFTRASQVTVILVVTYTNSTTIRGIPIGGTNLGTSVSYTYGGPTADQFYEEGAWSDDRGWPSTVCFFETRLVLGGTRSSPDEIWFSQINDIFEFDQVGLVTDTDYTDPIVTSDAFSITLRSNILNSIRWLSPKKNITAGTNFEEFVVQGPSEAKTIGIDNVQTFGETAIGSAPVQPVRVEAATVFLDRSRRRLKELTYNFDEDSLKTSDLNILAEHIGRKSQLLGLSGPEAYSIKEEAFFREMVRQAMPVGVVWCLDNYGCLAGMTREREQQVVAWHHHHIAGTVDSERPRVDAISCFMTGDRRYREVGVNLDVPEEDELWMTVIRNVGKDDGMGNIIYSEEVHLERMEKEWEYKDYGTDWYDDTYGSANARNILGSAPIYMDGTVARTNGDATLGVIPLSSLPHGAGAIVDVIVNGVYLGKKTISLGGLDLANDLTDLGLISGTWMALIGFSYSQRIVPLCSEVPAQIGSSYGQPRRIHEVVVGFSRTVSAKIWRRSDQDEENTPVDPAEEVVFKPGENQNDPIPLFTGDKRINFPQGYESRPRLVIQNDLPFPMAVTHVVMKMVVYE